MEGIRLNKDQFEKLNNCNVLDLGENYMGRHYEDISEDVEKYFEGENLNCFQLNDMFKEYLEILITPDNKVWGLSGENTNYIGKSSNIFSEAKRVLTIEE